MCRRWSRCWRRARDGKGSRVEGGRRPRLSTLDLLFAVTFPAYTIPSGAAMRLAGAFAASLVLVGCSLLKDESADQGTGDKSQWTLTTTLSRPTITIQHGGTDTVT